MSATQRESIAVKLAKTTLILAVILGLVVGLFQIARDFSDQSQRLEDQIDAILAGAEHSAGRAVYMLDSALAEEVVAGLNEYEFIVFAEILSDYEGVLAKAESPPPAKSWRTSVIAFFGKKFIFRQLPLTYSEDPGKVFGELRVRVDMERGVAGVFSRGVLIVLSEMVKSLVLAFLLFLIVVFLLARPLSALAESFNAIDPLDPSDKRIEVSKPHKATELGRLAENANRLLETSAGHIREREETENQLRRLFDSVQISIWDEDFTEIKKELQRLRRGGVVDLRSYIKENKHIAWDLAGRVSINRVNQAALKLYGVASQNEFIESLDQTFSGEAIDVFIEELCAIWEGAELVQAETTNVRIDGREITIILTMPVPKTDAEFRHVPISILDITARKGLEERVRHTQKMDALGQLTGGISHDFNNILGIIVGSLDLLKRYEQSNNKTLHQIEVAEKAAQRAIVLTNQLLLFSRKQAHRAAPTDINNLIRGMDNLIARSLTPAVEVEVQLAEEMWMTEIDSGEFEDALLNLIINARDAMPGGGKLTIETSKVKFDEDYAARNPDMEAGEFVQLAISDTGEGIAPGVINRIFEPFFTTKQQGRGTGLGLSMVFGFIERSNGFVRVYSEPGIGTTLRFYLRRLSDQSDITLIGCGGDDKLPHGTETVLLVDDEKDLLELAQLYIQDLGYLTLCASDGRQALELLESTTNIDLLFSDVVMSGGMSGYELAEQATRLYPGLKVLLTSGFTRNAVERNGQARFNTNLLTKPYTQSDLARRIRMVLDLDGFSR